MIHPFTELFFQITRFFHFFIKNRTKNKMEFHFGIQIIDDLCFASIHLTNNLCNRFKKKKFREECQQFKYIRVRSLCEDRKMKIVLHFRIYFSSIGLTIRKLYYCIYEPIMYFSIFGETI